MKYRKITTLRQQIDHLLDTKPEYDVLDMIQQNFENRSSSEYYEIARNLESIVEKLLVIANKEANCDCSEDSDSQPKSDNAQLGLQTPNGYPEHRSSL